ncbi:DUF4983 domain-containing protein [Mucilaginibacter sp. SMC90]|uniref:DUF4983 domain-containing protein n=1 Tax=Mucilaginibacter sp. SMC90 TaxID=2929803 RepID=UPI001FB311FA|nr:DUF4983 domain-containing protein [Mucilaginibacter sp. SMC90]UOE47785.1 DUF4983 domain-containing protein [Mucilaginibacter sp. SMC90]
MKKNKLTNKSRLLFARMLFYFAGILMVSCNKDFPNLLKKNYPAEPLSQGHGKVLYIIIDGARGKALGDTAVRYPEITKLYNNSLYTFSAIVDPDNEPVTNASAWATQLTGVGVAKNQVTTEDFAGNKLSEFPSFISLLKSYDHNFRIAAFSASAAFADHFTQSADQKQTFENSDEAVKAAVVADLQKNDRDLVLAQFHSVEAAGTSSNYDSTTPAYQAALSQVDSYVGEIMAALKGRPNYSAENWLVVITSNKGGKISAVPPANGTAFDDATRNIFTIFYSPRFTTQYLVQPSSAAVVYSGNAVKYTYANNNYVNATLSNPALYNIGTSGSYTYQFLFKNSYTNWIGYPTVLSKRVQDFGGAGFNLFLKGTEWWINSSSSYEISGGTVSDNQWHSITLTITRADNVTTMKTYTDGKFNNSGTWGSTTDPLSNNAPLRIGRIPNNGNDQPSIFVTNLQIYNVAFTDADVAALAGKTVIDSSHPYYENLVGYWPGDEVGKKVLKERTGKMGAGSDFVLSGPYSWSDFSDYSPVLSPPVSPSFYRTVPNSVDVPLQIMQWLSVTPNVNWQLDGKAFTPTYTAVTP